MHNKGNTRVWGRKKYMTAARGEAKREENQRGTSRERGETNNHSTSMRRREEHMEEQNRINKEKKKTLIDKKQKW